MEFKGYKTSSTPSFKGEVKPSASCQRFYGMLKNPSKYEKKSLAKLIFSFASFSCLLLDDYW
jgi:hypothetical protein